MSLVIENPADFRHILRICNSNVEGKRKICHGLAQIKGIGFRFANVVCKIAKLPTNMRAGELTEAQIAQLQNIIADPIRYGIPKWFLNRQKDFKDGTYSQLVANVLETKLREDLERMKKIKCNRGIRHHWGLRVRGQHTKSTGRTGMTLGVIRKKN